MKTGGGVGLGVNVIVGKGVDVGMGADVVTGGDVVVGVPFGAGVTDTTGSVAREAAVRVSSLETIEDGDLVGRGTNVVCGLIVPTSPAGTTEGSETSPVQAIARIVKTATNSPVALNPDMPPLILDG